MAFKRIISLFVVVLLLMPLCACSNVVSETTNIDETTELPSTKSTVNHESTIDPTKQETSDLNNNEEIKDNDHYMASFFGTKQPIKFETPTRTLYLGDMVFTYHSIFDNESHPLCFDPLCDHTSESCTYRIFENETGIYSKLDNRIYASRGDCLYSMAFNASDLRLEYKFSEFGTDLSKFLYKSVKTDRDNVISIVLMGIYDEYIYFKRADVPEDYTAGQKYTFSFYRFNIKTKQIENLSEKAGNLCPSNMCISEYGKIYFLANPTSTITGFVFYKSDLNFENIEQLDITPSPYNSKNTQKGMYVVEIDEYSQDGRVASKAHLSYFDFLTEEVTNISPILNITSNTAIQILLYDDECIFYTPYDAYELGKTLDYAGREKKVNVIYHDLYMSTNDGKTTQLIFSGIVNEKPEDKSYDIMGLKKVDNGYLITALVRTISENARDGERASIYVEPDEEGLLKIVSIEYYFPNLKYDV